MKTDDNLSAISLQRLNTCHPKLQELVNEIIKDRRILVMCGHRNEAEQNEAFSTGHSKEKWPDSKHNTDPSMAIDMSPTPYDPTNSILIIYFAGIVMGIAMRLGIKIRWGGDWNQNLDPSDEKFRDLYHFELT